MLSPMNRTVTALHDDLIRGIQNPVAMNSEQLIGSRDEMQK